MAKSPDKYWASLPLAENDTEFLTKLEGKVDDYYDHLTATGLRDLWQRSHRMMSWGCRDNTISKEGEQGEFDALRINHFANILEHIYVGVTSQRPSYQPRAMNTDYKSRAQTRSCDGLLEYYDRRKRGEEHQNAMVETCLVTGEGYRWRRWDRNAGKLVGLEQVIDDVQALSGAATAYDTGEEPKLRQTYEGDVVESNPHPMDVIRDTTADSWDACRWVIIRERRNRWDLIALYPEKEDEIRLASACDDDDLFDRGVAVFDYERSGDSDDVFLYTFLHDRTPAVLGGRRTLFLDGKTWLEDASFDELQAPPPGVDPETWPKFGLEYMLIRLSGGEIEGSPFGYTLAFDLMAPQDAVNIASSTMMTNLANHGVTNLTGPAGSEATLTKLSDGLNFIGVSGVRDGKIDVLELLSIPDVIFKFTEMVVGSMETRSGVNSVTRGNPEASLKSGTALALVQSQFLQFNKKIEGGYARAYEQAGTALVYLFRVHVPEPRMAAICGKGNAAYVSELKGDDLSQIDRVVCDLGPYLSRTAAGRLNLAEQLLQAGLLKNAADFMYVLENGRLDGALHDETDELLLIDRENERLLEGDGEVPILVFDNDPLHIQKHKKLLFSPEARENPEVATAVLAHCQAHINQMQTKDPVIAALIGQPSMPPAGGAPPAGTPPPGPAGGSPADTATLPAENPATGQPAKVSMPQAPAAPPA